MTLLYDASGRVLPSKEDPVKISIDTQWKQDLVHAFPEDWENRIGLILESGVAREEQRRMANLVIAYEAPNDWMKRAMASRSQTPTKAER